MELSTQTFIDMVNGGIYKEDIKPIELAKYIAKNYCSFDEAELALMDIYWDTAFNKGWLYVSPDMVENMFGYKENKDMMSKFATKLKNEYDENTDYQIVEKSDKLVIDYYSKVLSSKDARGGSLKKYYIINGETFKGLLISSRTDKGKQTRRYYIKIEQLCVATFNAIAECVKIINNKERDMNKKALADATAELEASKKENSEIKQKNIKLNEFVKVAQELKKDEIFYIATSPLCAEMNRFKYGGVSGVKELNGRLAGYNTGHMANDAFYFAKIYKCHKYRHIENCIEMLTKVFKDKTDSRKEILHIRFNCLIELVEFILENDNKSIDYINEHGKRFLDETIGSVAIIPQPVSIDDHFSEPQTRKSKKIKDARIDVSEWESKRLRDAMKQIVVDCAKEKYGEEFDIENSQEKIDLTWAELVAILEIKYVGKTRTTWKSELKNLVNDMCVKIGWKTR